MILNGTFSIVIMIQTGHSMSSVHKVFTSISQILMISIYIYSNENKMFILLGSWAFKSPFCGPIVRAELPDPQTL